MFAPSSAFLGPLPAAPPPSSVRRAEWRARLLVVAALGLAVPLVVAPVAVAAVPEPSLSPEPASAASGAVGGSALVPTGAPGWQRTGHLRPGVPWAEWEQRRQRHHPASAPERAGRVPEQAAEQGVEQAPGQSPEQPVEQAPEQPADTAPDPAADTPSPAGPSGSTGSETLALGRPGPLLPPTRWDDASTRQLPLGAGLGLIGCGLGLIGLRLRRG
ncbi:hypothetical protein GCM10009639_15160 [Kitasatospora putterlickiae]|uniref:Uncharacterized protein n=1 Tax=Kitasatospora putterlickiae TaxID=221725 RepID=A0ABN1XRU0_9ACTN